MAKAGTARIEQGARGRRGLPLRAIVVAAFAAACAAVVYIGVPAPGVSVGDIARETVVARARFTSRNIARTNELRSVAREKALSEYVERPNWRKDLFGAVETLLSAVESAADLDAARGTLRANGVDIDPAPLWEAMRGDAGRRRGEIMRSVEAAVGDLAKAGVIDDARMDFELVAGRQGIVRRDEDGTVVEAPFGTARQPGVLSVGSARGNLARSLRDAFPGRPRLAEALAAALSRSLGPTLRFHAEHTRERREKAAADVEEVRTRHEPGDVIVSKGYPIDADVRENILREAEAYRAGRPLRQRLLRLLGILVLVGAIAGVVSWAATRLDPGAVLSSRVAFFVCLFDLIVVGATKVLVVWGLPALLSPVALVAILLALSVSPLLAAVNVVGLAAVVALAAGSEFSLPVTLVAGGIVGGLAAARTRRRSELLRAGAVAGVVQLAAVAAAKLCTGVEDVAVLLDNGGWALLNGAGCGLVVLGLLPIAEAAFGVTTDISLLELSDQNHPALRRLLTEASGTYHHSLIVGNLSEAAALAVGANALLARVASYYHDLGKIDRPEYFIENKPPGRSRHDALSPTMSTLIITSHVRDGIALGRQYRLPRAILDVIAQHHGTSIVEFFYRAAKDRAQDGGIDDQLFRYPGPKPRTREAAIVLLADSVEAASRALADPTSVRLKKLVAEIIMKRLLDGQFDESGLTLTDLKVVQECFIRVLSSMFHSRVRYPEDGSGPQLARSAAAALGGDEG